MTRRQGVLPVDKVRGPTSHDVVAAVRRALQIRRVGHTGTLDPFATGLMLVCVGTATRLAEYLTGMDKEYLAVARLGMETDTLDVEGEVVGESSAWSTLELADLEKALNAFRGELQQIPPQYSAKKVGGEAMHRKARRGERVELEPRQVTVHGLELVEWDPPHLTFRVHCSTGTYIRALARDLGRLLGVGAHLTELRRTRVGDFSVEGAIPSDVLPETGVPESAWIEPLEAVRHLPAVEVTPDDARALAQGRRLSLEAPDESVVVVSSEGELVAMGEIAGGVLKPRKVLATELAGGGG